MGDEFMSINLTVFLLLAIFSLPVIFAYGDSESENDLLLKKGIEHFGQEEYERAISYFDEILESEPNHVEALYNKGNTLSKIEKYNESISYFEQVLKLDPGKYIARLKLENSLLEVTSYNYGFLDGVLEITVHDSNGGFVAYLRTTKIKAVEHEIVENLVEKWPVTKIINQNNQELAVHQQEYMKFVDVDSIYGFHEIPFSEEVDFPLATTWHYQIPVERGDVISYIYSIFRPII